MSRYFSHKYETLTPYTPGEQPRERKYIKLNTNESPFAPGKAVVEAAGKAAGSLQLYSDILCRDLTGRIAQSYGLRESEVILTNGSDEILNFAFMAYTDEDHPAAFADITYGFYPVFAELNRTPYTLIPLREDFTIDPDDYIGLGKTIFIANPNAPTGIALSRADIERIVEGNPDSIVVVDEAYVDFGAESAVPLIRSYDNLLVTQTFSKSRSLAGGRLGIGLGCESLIRDMNTIKFATNPYNINSMSLAAGCAAWDDWDTFLSNTGTIREVREMTTKRLQQMGFTVLPSRSNFVFASHPDVSGEQLYLTLKERGILIRHFSLPRISNFNRITIGTEEQMKILLDNIQKILEE